MIYTITFNPSIDYIVRVDELNINRVNRSVSEVRFPGGKGINVSKVLNNLSVDTTALGYIAGYTGEYILNSLTDEGVKTDFIKVDGESRINVKLNSKQDETEINGMGPVISDKELKLLIDKISKLNENDLLVLAGSVQKSVPSDIYKTLQEIASKNKVKVIVDTSGNQLLEAIKLKPFLIKPNNHEIEEIFGVKLKNEEEIIAYGKKLRELGAQNVIISLAGDGAILITENGVYRGNVPKGELVNSVGAGDSLVGGFLASYSNDKDIISAFRYGIASGSASAFSLELCKLKDVERLVEEINIREL